MTLDQCIMLAPAHHVSSLSYLDELWWSMHPTESDGELVVGLTSYLDDSGSDDNSPITVIGGPVFSRIQFNAFSKRWDKLLKKYPIPQPLHMTDFVRPYGKYAGMYPEIKRNLFGSVAKLINEHKLYSLSIAVPQVDFRQLLQGDLCKLVAGPYALAFFSAVLLNAAVAKREGLGQFAYLVDRGFSFSSQLDDAHRAITKVERERSIVQTGSLTFQSDDTVPALQAADVIAWSARRRDAGELTEEYEPLHEVLEISKRRPHMHIPLPTEAILMLAEPIYAWIFKHGSVPSFSDFLR